MIGLLSDFNAVASVTKAYTGEVHEGDILVMDGGKLRVSVASDAGKPVFISFGDSDSYDVSTAGVVTAFWGPSRWKLELGVHVDSSVVEGDSLQIGDNQFVKWVDSIDTTNSVAPNAANICAKVEAIDGNYAIIRLL